MFIRIITWLSLAGLFLSTGSETSGNRETSGFNSTAENVTLSIPEDSPIGTVVGNITSPLHNASNISFNIVDGDPYGRFSVSAEGSEGVIRVANPLDFRVRSRYDLRVLLECDTCDKPWQQSNKTTYSVRVDVIDVEDYPPLYNTTCETPEREGIPQRLFNLSNYIFTIGDGQINNDLQYNSTSAQDQLRNKISFQSDNDNCAVTFVSGLHALNDLGWADIISAQGTTANCSSNQPAMDVRFHFVRRARPAGSPTISFQDLLKNHLINPHWLKDERYSYFFFFQIDPYQTSSPATFKCDSTPFDFGITEQKTTYSIQVTVDKLGCARGTFGPWCDQDCVCKNGARCHGFNGACLCTPGWIGVACDIPTPAVAIRTLPREHIYIGSNVTLSCTAVHINVASIVLMYSPFHTNTVRILSNETTDIEFTINTFQSENNGVYTCVAETAGTGALVETELMLNVTSCPPNLQGRFCDDTCDCRNGGRCDRWNGCVCLSGWRGRHCDRPCPHGRYGLGCLSVCACQNSGVCDHITGTCSCRAPWTGHDCSRRTTSLGNTNLLLTLLVIPVLVSVAALATIILRRKAFRNAPQREEGDIELEEVVGENDEERTVRRRLAWERCEQHLTIVKMIGQGTFGHVVLAKLRTPGKEPVMVAAKSISLTQENRDGSERCYRDFYREADILISLHDRSEHWEGNDQRVHPNIVQLHGIITNTEPKRILLEYAPRGDLLNYLRRSRQDPDTRLTDLVMFAVHISRALHELESLKIVHRDVAARNVLISDGGIAKLADFGLARDVYANSVYVHTKHLGQDDLLPLKWMALESLRDGVFTSHSDVWSFGVLLWEIATFGEEPRYPGSYRPDCGKLVRILRRGTRLEQPDMCPVSLYRLMCQCWAKEPEDRPDAVRLESRLQEIVNGMLE